MTNAIALLLLTFPAQAPQGSATLWASPVAATAKVDLAQQKMLEAMAGAAMLEALAKLPKPEPEPEPEPSPEPEVPVAPVAQPVTYYRIVPQYYHAPVVMPSYVPVQNYQPPCLPTR